MTVPRRRSNYPPLVLHSQLAADDMVCSGGAKYRSVLLPVLDGGTDKDE